MSKPPVVRAHPQAPRESALTAARSERGTGPRRTEFPSNVVGICVKCMQWFQSIPTDRVRLWSDPQFRYVSGPCYKCKTPNTVRPFPDQTFPWTFVPNDNVFAPGYARTKYVFRCQRCHTQLADWAKLGCLCVEREKPNIDNEGYHRFKYGHRPLTYCRWCCFVDHPDVYGATPEEVRQGYDVLLAKQAEEKAAQAIKTPNPKSAKDKPDVNDLERDILRYFDGEKFRVDDIEELAAADEIGDAQERMNRAQQAFAAVQAQQRRLARRAARQALRDRANDLLARRRREGG